MIDSWKPVGSLAIAGVGDEETNIAIEIDRQIGTGSQLFLGGDRWIDR